MVHLSRHYFVTLLSAMQGGVKQHVECLLVFFLPLSPRETNKVKHLSKLFASFP
jgi:hypothetical protein